MSGLLEGSALAAIPGAVAAGLLAGALLPLLGVWVVAQRVVFLGITLAQVAASGVALGLLLGWPALGVGVVLTLLVAVSVVGRASAATAGAGDGVLGAVFCCASALALMFVSRSAADLDEVTHVLHGNLIYASSSEVALTGVMLALAAGITLIFRRPLLFSVFDPEAAAAMGLAARRWILLLFALLAVALTVCMRTTGSLLSFALLLLPALSALALRRGVAGTFVAASLLGLLGTAAGLLFSVHADLHLESSIVACLGAQLLACLGWRVNPLLGVVLAAAAVAGALALGAEPESPASHPHHHALPPEGLSEPWHADVTLAAQQDGNSLRVSWTLDVLRTPGDAPLPADLWIVLTGDGLFHEHELLHDLQHVPTGSSRHTGSCLVSAPPGLHRLEGQLWTGSPMAVGAEPVAPGLGDVIGVDVGR